MFDWLDGDLVHFNKNDEILKIYSRPTSMSRGEYRFICQNMIDSQEDVWEFSKIKWKNLSDSKKEIIETKVRSEFQNFMDIREGLLATLSDYQGLIDIKRQFRDIILSVEFK